MKFKTKMLLGFVFLRKLFSESAETELTGRNYQLSYTIFGKILRDMDHVVVRVGLGKNIPLVLPYIAKSTAKEQTRRQNEYRLTINNCCQ